MLKSITRRRSQPTEPLVPRLDPRHWRGGRVRAALVALAVAAFAASPTPAGATSGGSDGVLADGLAGPLSIDVTARGDVLVGQSFGGLVSSVSKRGVVTDLVAENGASAVAAGPFGVVVYTVGGETGTSLLKLRLPWGSTKVLADLGAFEAASNPDAVNSYGFEEISDECAAQWPIDEAGPPQYEGLVDSNPYSLAVTLRGVYVADAAANAIVFVDWRGAISVAAVLPPQRYVLPADPTSLGLPSCVGGLAYDFEPVPTDIELSRSGAFVSLLPGGPEDPALGARGSVVKVDLRNGRSSPVATGFAGATGLAVSPDGQVYVAEIIGGRVSKVTRSGIKTVAVLNEPAAIEWSDGRLFVSYDVFGSGKVASLRP